MSQPASRFSFSSKTFNELFTIREFSSNDLHSHDPLCSQVRCPVNRSHTSLPQQVLDPVLIVEQFSRHESSL